MSRTPRECREKQHTVMPFLQAEKKTKDFFKLKKLKGRYKRKKISLSLLSHARWYSFSSPPFAHYSSPSLALYHSSSPPLACYYSKSTWWSLVVDGRCSQCSMLGGAARSHRHSLFPSSPLMAATPDLLGGRCSVVLLVSPSTMFSPAANLQSLSPCKFQLPAHPHAPIVRSALRALILFLVFFTYLIRQLFNFMPSVDGCTTLNSILIYILNGCWIIFVWNQNHQLNTCGGALLTTKV